MFNQVCVLLRVQQATKKYNDKGLIKKMNTIKRSKMKIKDKMLNWACVLLRLQQATTNDNDKSLTHKKMNKSFREELLESLVRWLVGLSLCLPASLSVFGCPSACLIACPYAYDTAGQIAIKNRNNVTFYILLSLSQ